LDEGSAVLAEARRLTGSIPRPIVDNKLPKSLHLLLDALPGAATAQRRPRYRRKLMPSGTVKWFDAKKGYGYIQPDSGEGDIKFHLSDATSSELKPPRDGERVDYDLQPGYGTTIAVNLRLPSVKLSTERGGRRVSRT